MHPLRNLKAIAATLAFCLASIASASVARADDAAPNPYDGKLDIELTPYVWAPTLNGSFRYNLSDLRTPAGEAVAADLTKTFDTNIGPNSYLAKINFALMFNGTIRKGNLALYTDLLNANVSSAGGRVVNITGPLGNLNASLSATSQSQIVTTLWTVGPSFTVYHDKRSAFDLLVGGQFIYITANAGLQLTDAGGDTFSAGASKRENYGDFIVGSYGHVGLGGKWSLPYYIDGGFGTPSTWQGIVGLKYGRTQLSWRHLQFNAGNQDALLQRLTLDGPLLGYTLSF